MITITRVGCRGLLLLAFPLGVSACTHDAPNVGVLVTDSAGVRVAVDRGARRQYAQIEDTPLLSLGGPEADGPEQFSNIRGLHVDSAYNLWVLDGASAELRIFARDGSHWKTRGRRGEGPGEFMRPRLLGGFGRDSVAVWDDGTARLTVFDAEGEVARIQVLSSDMQASVQPVAIFHDGTLLARERTILHAGQLEPDELLTDSASFIRLNLSSGRTHALANVDGPLWIWTGRLQVPMPFTTNPGLALEGQALHLVAGADFRVRVFQAGQLVETYGVARDRREVTSQDIAAFRDIYEGAMPESEQRRQYLAALDHPDRPQHLPAYVYVQIATDGASWAQIYDTDRLAAAVWDVFAPSREWLGQVETPGGLTVQVVSGDRLAGIWRDELGVEYVRVYRVVRIQ